MKKLIVSVAAMLMALICPLSCFASLKEDINNQQAKFQEKQKEHTPTQKRGIVEFCEMYMQRYMEFQIENGFDYYSDAFAAYGAPMTMPDGTLIIHSDVGSLIINSDDLTINSATMVFYDPNGSSEKNMEYAARCAMAISALEYSQQDDKIMRLTPDFMGGPSNAISAAKSIYSTITMKNAQQDYQSGDEQDKAPLYSGNYDYYVDYLDYSVENRSHNYFALLAKEH